MNSTQPPQVELMLSYEDARAKVIETIHARPCPAPLEQETISIAGDPAQALGRVLAESILADRNYPPFNRSTRDGFAVKAADATTAGVKLRIVGESRAGVPFIGVVESGTAVQTMTGAPMPRGTNSVVMNEYATVDGEWVTLNQPAQISAHYVLEGQEARVGESVVPRGKRLGFAELAMATQVGRSDVQVAKKPRVAILPTGDELIALDQTPNRFQIRNTNTTSLAAQVTLAGGEPVLLRPAPDSHDALCAHIEEALQADIVIITGGVSVGKYDLVEQVLKELKADFYFDGLKIRPGKPAVFGFCQGKPVFGLPGNPVSTMVTFELIVVPAIDLLSGHAAGPIPTFEAKLAHPLDERPPFAHFLPARVNWHDGAPTVEMIHWEGSGDIGSVVRGNCFLVVHESKLKYAAGEMARVLLRRGTF
jgi:molybdopterin molybdotransferase